jgi:chain length determinant protein EpsF
MNISKFLAILKARWIGALFALVAGVAGALVAHQVLPRKYTATAAVLVDTKTADPLLGGMAALANIGTQVEVIKSERVARRVVRDLKLTENYELRRQWQNETSGAGNYEAWVATLIGKPLDAKPGGQSNVISISYSATDPKFTAAITNAFVRAYMDTAVELRVDPAKRFNTFFDERSKDLKERYEAAQAKLTAFQRVNQIIATDERVDIENQRLNELNAQLTSMQGMAAEAQSRTAQAKAAQNQSQDVINNATVAGLRNEISRQEAKLQELNSRLGEAHPQVLELQANMAELKKKLDDESRRVTSSVAIAGNITNARLADAKNALEAQRAKVLKLREQRDELSLIVKEVENAQRAYDAIVARATQTSLESQSNQTNISLLADATEPTSPTTPKPLPQMLMLGVLGGLGLGLAYMFMREFMDRRLRTLDDVSTVLGLPVLGEMPKPAGRIKAGTANDTLLMPNNVVRGLPGPSNPR